MNNNFVHMRDQKANQMAMLAKYDRQALADRVEEITLVVVLWGMFFVASMT